MSNVKIDIEGGRVTQAEIAEIKAQEIKLINKYYSSSDNSIIPNIIIQKSMILSSLHRNFI